MARLMIIYNPHDQIELWGNIKPFNVKEALLEVKSGLANRDIYTIAKELAELLLRQIEE